MNLKHLILILSIAGSAFLLFVRTVSFPEGCYQDGSSLVCLFMSETAHNLSILFPFILLFSLITFKRESAFTAWWKFARIAAPAIFLVSFLISLELHHRPGGWFNIDNEIDLVIHFVMYAVFVIGSVVQIFRGRRRIES